MPFVKGQSGNPAGRAQDKLWRDAVRLAVSRYHGDKDAPFPAKAKIIDVLAHKLVTKALEGDVPAMKEVGDRLDGKAAQTVDMNHNASDVFLNILEHITHGRLADGVAEQPGQPASVRH